jgi:hypothetical protein
MDNDFGPTGLGNAECGCRADFRQVIHPLLLLPEY